ncbi:hypothetical protein [Herbiconiux liangxiaofengii]|uniref:hypothetical protein n=1 Tax=Herbiconiux liangxiaofengii TaxID=3342795 RepID=UPI0035B9630A
MTDEEARARPQPSIPGELPTADQAIEALSDRAGAFYSALMNEHFVLESARGITVSEASSRAALYLTTLSSSLVAFGFLAQTDYALGFLMVVIPTGAARPERDAADRSPGVVGGGVLHDLDRDRRREFDGGRCRRRHRRRASHLAAHPIDPHRLP